MQPEMPTLKGTVSLIRPYVKLEHAFNGTVMNQASSYFQGGLLRHFLAQTKTNCFNQNRHLHNCKID